MKEKYLPIGSVVLLKGATKKVMITGFYVRPKGNTQILFDYSGCMYPEGIISNNQTPVFNHDQIKKIIHLGLQNDEEIEFKKNLKEMISKEGNN